MTNAPIIDRREMVYHDRGDRPPARHPADVSELCLDCINARPCSHLHVQRATVVVTETGGRTYYACRDCGATTWYRDHGTRETVTTSAGRQRERYVGMVEGCDD